MTQESSLLFQRMRSSLEYASNSTNRIPWPPPNASISRCYLGRCYDGRLHGRWIDADQPIEVIREQIAAMLAESKEPTAEEWAIRNCDNSGGLQLSESEDGRPTFTAARHGRPGPRVRR
jgi:antirestriction protein